MSNPSTPSTPVKTKDSFLGVMPFGLTAFEPIEVMGPDAYGPLISSVRFLDSPSREPTFDVSFSPYSEVGGHNLFPPKIHCPYPLDDPRCQGRENGYEPLEVSQRAIQQWIALYQRSARAPSVPTSPRAWTRFAGASSPPSGVLLPAWEEPGSAGFVGESQTMEDVMDTEEVREPDNDVTSAMQQNNSNHPHSSVEVGSGSEDDGGVLFPEDKERLCRYISQGLSLMSLLLSRVMGHRIRCNGGRVLVGEHWEEMEAPCTNREFGPDDYQRHVKERHVGIPRNTSISSWVHAYRPMIQFRRDNAELFASGALAVGLLPKRVRRDR